MSGYRERFSAACGAVHLLVGGHLELSEFMGAASFITPAYPRVGKWWDVCIVLPADEPLHPYHDVGALVLAWPHVGSTPYNGNLSFEKSFRFLRPGWTAQEATEFIATGLADLNAELEKLWKTTT